ncbi:MAG TPA: 2-amino-4-hydroxy-6-hydroxymethyldihydropteridine diphosphokinase [Ferruginibacter sp.]|jgi:2-amino-4-hydroxy-6-hydroxymethyldihydropteridine diphosphokinase|nr:2-amino-4-hydroxy-6-hydroxymethyldihydropteridine diphosphokinase [Ferruginibacter sp.]
MNKIYFLLGSNMGNSKQQLDLAVTNIENEAGKVAGRSSIYQTAAWGKTDQPDFLNQVIIVATPLTAEKTLATILAIEEKMGRVRTEKNAPRIIDIDILFFNEERILQKDLIVPHPEIQNRRFVLIPLNEVSPDFIHPVFNKPIHELLEACTDELNVKKF